MKSWRGLVRDAGCDPDAVTVEAMLLTAAFLRIAAASQDETRVDHRDANKSIAIDHVIDVVNGLLGRRLAAVRSELLPGAIARELCDALDDCAVAPLWYGVVAFVTARCLDARLGRTFADAFRARSGERLRSNMPVPVVAFPVETLTPAARSAVLAALRPRTGDPRRRVDAVDRTDHLRLAPAEVEQWRVTTTWADPWMDAVDASTRFAAGVTNHAPLRDELEWTTYTAGSRSVFYDVRPMKLDVQRRRVEAALDDARRAGATIVVLPELCLTRSLFEELDQRGVFGDFALVVAGSYHKPVARHEPGSNVSHVLANGELVFTHRKFADFYIGDCHEHLARTDSEAGFALLISPNCTAVTLICKDALGRVGDLVQDLAPTLLLVPAMSEDTVDFELLARRLAHDPQSFTLVACAGPNASAIFGRPSLQSQVIVSSSDPARCLVFSPHGEIARVK